MCIYSAPFAVCIKVIEMSNGQSSFVLVIHRHREVLPCHPTVKGTEALIGDSNQNDPSCSVPVLPSCLMFRNLFPRMRIYSAQSEVQRRFPTECSPSHMTVNPYSERV